MRSFLRQQKGFTILEMLVAITLFAMIITSVVWAVQTLSIARIKSMNRIAILEQLYYFSEQFFTSIKDGGTLDYEEYWNRAAVGTGMSTNSGGHYEKATGVGNYGGGGDLQTTLNNYGAGLYLCRSNNTLKMGTGGCLSEHNNGASGVSPGAPQNFSGAYQRYGQYRLQFIDYNGNADDDNGKPGDENGDGNIIGDDDDIALGDAPAFGTGVMRELYLINKREKTRTFFRWKIVQDPDAPSGVVCSVQDTGGRIQTSSGCTGTIQILKMDGYDLGVNHDEAGTTAYDGVIDTWVLKKDWPGTGIDILPAKSKLATGRDDEWIPLFPKEINVKGFSMQMYPVKDPWLSWGAPDATQGSTEISPFIHPYIRFNMDMGFAWSKRRALRNEDPTISISTTVSLSDFE